MHLFPSPRHNYLPDPHICSPCRMIMEIALAAHHNALVLHASYVRKPRHLSGIKTRLGRCRSNQQASRSSRCALACLHPRQFRDLSRCKSLQLRDTKQD